MQIQTIITAIVCYFIEGETISKWDVIGIMSSLSGVMVIYNPWKKYEDKDYNYSLGIILAMGTALAAGSNMSILRYMKQDIHYTRGPLFFYLGGLFFSPFLFFTSKLNETLPIYDKKT
jgi:drug/metabolite transporter (DMT)-like permease